MTIRPVRIANAQAFWGDRNAAAAEMVARVPDLDYLTLDYLAEVSMSILAVQRERDPSAGFARDFLEVVRSLAPYWAAGGQCRLITNAGGLNPRGCAQACAAVLQEAGCRPLRIGIVSGDDVRETLRQSPAEAAYRNLDSHAPLIEVLDRLVTANAYLGSAPLVEALALGADIVITGRVADPSLAVAACVHHFKWPEFAWNELAGATVAGHLIECGTQVTGGISTDWLDVPDPAHIGFPIVEVSADASCVVTKPPDTGGCVTEQIVKEQLLYEIGDPGRYLSPDVSVSFLSLRVEDLGHDRVKVTGAGGAPRPDTYKVSATYRDGYRAAGTLTIIGRDAAAKARRCGQVVLERVRASGYSLRETVIECLGEGGLGAYLGAEKGTALPRCDSSPLFETVLRVAVEADAREAVECFSRELMPLITCGPQGTTGYAEGRPRVHPVFRFWPCLIARDAVQPQVEIIESRPPLRPRSTIAGPETARRVASLPSPRVARVASDSRGAADSPRRLRDLAFARSGDKGVHANVGVMARTAEAYAFLVDWLTAERVAEFFRPLGGEAVERYELPNLQALNFVVRGVLRCSLRNDAQGKALGQRLLEMPLDEPA